MELILKQLLESVDEDILENPENEESDEVSFYFYGDCCSCTKQAKCRSSKCICFVSGRKCSTECHGGLKSNCANK